MKKFKLKAIAVALLASMTVSAAILPSKAAKVGEGIDVPDSGVVTYDFNSSENPLEENKTGTYDKSANGTSGIVLSENETVFKIGFGPENIYTPVNWDTDLVRKSMSLRINNQGIINSGDVTFQRIILWYQDANNWLGLDWKISDDKKTYDTRISGKNSSLSRVKGSADPTVLFAWNDLTNNGKMPIGENDGWIQFNAEYTDVNTIKLSWYKESAPETVYKSTLSSTFNFDNTYDITSATTGTVITSSYFTKYDWRKGLFGIAGTGTYYDENNNSSGSPQVGYYDDLSVTLDVEPAEVRDFKKTYADVLALDADALYAKFSTDYAAFTADIANIDKAFAAFFALSDSSKEMLASQKAALEKLIGTKKKAEAYLGNDINVDFEDGLSAETSIEMNTSYGSETTGRDILSVIENPFKQTGNTSAKVVRFARDGNTGSSNMIHKIKYTDADSSNAIANVSFKMYFNYFKGNNFGARVYFNYDDAKSINTQDYINFYADGANEPLQFVYKKYDTAAAKYTDSYSSAIKTADGTANLGTMAGQWYTVNIAYTDTGFSVTLTTADGVTSRVVSKPADNTLSANAFAIGMTQYASDSYYDDFKVTFRTPYTMTMLDKAWIRDTAASGIRFGTETLAANELYNNASDCTVVASGALFMPKAYLADGELLTVESTKTANSFGKKARGNEKTETAMPENIYGVLINVIDNDKFDVKQQLVCRVYIKYRKANDPTGAYRYAYADSNSYAVSVSEQVVKTAKNLVSYTGEDYAGALAALKAAGYLGGNK